MMVVVATTIIVVKYAKLLDRYGYSRHEPNLSDVVSANRIRRCPYMAGKTQTDVFSHLGALWADASTLSIHSPIPHFCDVEVDAHSLAVKDSDCTYTPRMSSCLL
jgi:hypothetical protein